MSGRLPYHVNQIILGMNNPDWDMPSEMTAMPRKLKQGGYATHMVGSASLRITLSGSDFFFLPSACSRHVCPQCHFNYLLRS